MILAQSKTQGSLLALRCLHRLPCTTAPSKSLRPSFLLSPPLVSIGDRSASCQPEQAEEGRLGSSLQYSPHADPLPPEVLFPVP